MAGAQRRFTKVYHGTATTPVQLKSKNDDNNRSPPGIPPLILYTSVDAEDIGKDEDKIVVEDVYNDEEDDEDVILVELPAKDRGHTVRTHPD